MATSPFEGPQQRTAPPTTPSTERPEWDVPGTGGPPVGVPSVDIVDNDADLWVFVDLPGFAEDEIEVVGDQQSLVVTADRPAGVEEGRRVVVLERPNRVERLIPLPTPVDVSEAVATFENGSCKVSLPKQASEHYTTIDIESS